MKKTKEWAEFAKMVKERSYEKRNVVLVSGKKSDFYVDLKNTLLHPRGVELASLLIAKDLSSLDGELSGVGGITMGADPISTGVSLATLKWNKPLMAFYIRKEPKDHGTSQWVEGIKNLNRGDEVYILEDVVTTGGSSLKAVDRAVSAGLKVKGIFTCVDREEGGREKIEAAGVELRTLLTKTDILNA